MDICAMGKKGARNKWRGKEPGTRRQEEEEEAETAAGKSGQSRKLGRGDPVWLTGVHAPLFRCPTNVLG